MYRPTSYTMRWDMEYDAEASGRQMRRMRLKHHLTLDQLSELFELTGYTASKTAIRKWETGDSMPTLVRVLFLAELYNCSLDELVLSYRRSRSDEDRDQPIPRKRILKYKTNVRDLRTFVFFFWELLVHLSSEISCTI